MTRNDIDHLAEVCESVFAQIQNEPLTQSDFQAFVSRVLWAIHASEGNPMFNEQAFKDRSEGKEAEMFS